MLFEIEFATKENGHFQTIHTALVHALNVSECRQIASEIADQLGTVGIHFFITEFID
ncbi:hypothetical protein [Thermaerobacillus caldiproteolyticus]|uniref:hypothetical protein n=1 Tax=Thermaerobacillus caldiproteolyticus TaxID=247480 RepID=UPI0018F1CCB2|nr:hypothetical protein [Anoxybacillus caldiproteolyticus]